MPLSLTPVTNPPFNPARRARSAGPQRPAPGLRQRSLNAVRATSPPPPTLSVAYQEKIASSSSAVKLIASKIKRNIYLTEELVWQARKELQGEHEEGVVDDYYYRHRRRQQDPSRSPPTNHRVMRVQHQIKEVRPIHLLFGGRKHFIINDKSWVWIFAGD